MLYRKVTNFVESKTAGSGKGGMTEQVGCGRNTWAESASLMHRVCAIFYTTNCRSVTVYWRSWSPRWLPKSPTPRAKSRRMARGIMLD